MDFYVGAKLLGSILIFVSGVFAYHLQNEVSHISETQANYYIGHELQAITAQSTDREKIQQLEDTKWNYITSRLNPIYEYTQKKSFIDQYSDQPALFYMAALGGLLVILGEASGLIKNPQPAPVGDHIPRRQRQRRNRG